VLTFASDPRHLPKALGFGLIERAFSLLPPYVAWRTMAFALRGVGLKMGKSSAFWGMPTFTGAGDVLSRLSIGESCGFNLGCHFELDDQITIEDHVSVGHQVTFLTKRRSASGDLLEGSAPVKIGQGAWLGARCVVMPGVTIGAGSVIGASVVVSEDIAPNILFSGGRKISIAKWR
jgi:maltose O-acetyltransferase